MIPYFCSVYTCAYEYTATAAATAAATIAAAAAAAGGGGAAVAAAAAAGPRAGIDAARLDEFAGG